MPSRGYGDVAVHPPQPIVTRMPASSHGLAAEAGSGRTVNAGRSAVADTTAGTGSPTPAGTDSTTGSGTGSGASAGIRARRVVNAMAIATSTSPAPMR